MISWRLLRIDIEAVDFLNTGLSSDLSPSAFLEGVRWVVWGMSTEYWRSEKIEKIYKRNTHRRSPHLNLHRFR